MNGDLKKFDMVCGCHGFPDWRVELIVYETLFLLLVYLLSCIHVFWIVPLASVLPSQNNPCELFNPHVVGESRGISSKQIVDYLR